ncbi:MAG TPA: Crp/Fnr family transcriptional regulator [Ramlibacter sp.]
MKARVLALQDTTEAASCCTLCQVRPKALFGVLPGPELQQASAATTPLSLQQGERLYTQGDAGSAVYTVRSGIVRFERVTSGGECRIVRLAGVGALIGQEALLRAPYAEDAVACTPLQVCRIPVDTVESNCAQQPALRRELMRRWQAALEAAGEWNAELARGHARRRMLKLMAQLRQLSADGSTIWLPSRQEMSEMLGLAPETASRLVSRLRREGVLQVDSLTEGRVDDEKLSAALRRADA